MASSRAVRRYEVQQELWAGLATEAAIAGVTEQSLLRAILRATLISLRRSREGAGDPVALGWAEGCPKETAARRHLQDFGLLHVDGSLAVGDVVVGIGR